MRVLTTLQAAAAILIAFIIFVIAINGCRGTREDLSKIPVNPKFENTPPPVGDITIQQIEGNKNGNVLFVADFGKALGQEQFHAVMVGDEKIVLRDDGKNGDSIARDGKFSIVLKEDIAEMQRQIDESNRVLRSQKEFISFSMRTMIRTPVEQLLKEDFRTFVERRPFKISPIFSVLCSPRVPVEKEKSLMITHPSVVEDTLRTFNPCTGKGNPDGAWAFPKLISEMANTPVTGVSASDFLKKWLETWLTNVTVNADVILKRTQINTIINRWSTLSKGTFDIKFAPFKLIAIVNRLDLRGNGGYGFSNPGEGRFVFCAINCDNGTTSVVRNPGPFMIIFEYGLPFKKCAELKAYAKQWSDLSGLALPGATYNKALELITNQFAMANTSPSKPNGSSLNQIRTNEFALHPDPPATGIDDVWELREFNIDSTTHLLKNVTVKREPQVRFNKVHPSQIPADVTTLAAFVNSNTPAVEANTYTINEIEGGKNFLAGKAHTLNGFGYHWNGSPIAPPPPNPEYITSDSARFVLSLHTCSGCHGGEANTGNFMHVAPGGGSGVPATLSGFLTGNPPMTSGGFVVTDRALRPNPPGTGKPREFNDLEFRKNDLEGFVACTCTPRVRVFEIARILRLKPLNSTH
jgi:hypothetical protein